MKDAGELIDQSEPEEKVLTLWHTIRNEIIQSKPALISLILLLIIILTAFSVRLFIDEEAARRIDLHALDIPPGGLSGGILGTDHGGRDMFIMLLLSARTSFILTFWVTFITVVWGVLYGLFSGYYGGHVDNIMMRFIDLIVMLPTLMTVIFIIAMIPFRGTWQFVLVLSAFNWADRARLIRSKVMHQASLDYVSASKTLGSRGPVIIFRDIFPNILSLVLTNATLSLAYNMGIETGLTILGYGMHYTTPSLGIYIGLARDTVVLMFRPWQWLPPAILITIMILCIYIIGNAISRAVDPKQQLQK
ncbi:MAG: ABC transporter permease [Treponema sp.]|nr:ABC transporter permease [Treponema sp.]